MVLKQYGAGSELVHCHVTLTVETFVTRAVTSVGVGGAEGGNDAKSKQGTCRITISCGLAQSVTGADSGFSKGDLVHGNGACLGGPLSQEGGVSLVLHNA